MASSLLALLDDITLLADDVAAMSKVAAKKTAGVLGDDIALNANQVTGIAPSRELPVIMAVAKGSAVNKAILVPIALLLVAFAPWSLTPLLMVGGAFLCYEGVEKVFHKLLHSDTEDATHHRELVETVQKSPEQIVEMEREKIKGAVRTDFILSAEILAISLGTMQDAPFTQQAVVLVAIAIAFTIGVYAVVAAVVKLDDLGLALATAPGKTKQASGRFILQATPYFMKTLSFVGTVALFLVGGGIIVHGIPALHHIVEWMAHALQSLPGAGPVLAQAAPTIVNLLTGLVVGSLVVAAVTLYARMFRQKKAQPDA